LQNTSLIIWDEFLSNHKQCLECAYNALDGFKNIVVVCMGDYRQIAPVVINGFMQDIVRASVISSRLWSKFNLFQFSKNMRLQGLESISSNFAQIDLNASLEDETTSSVALHNQKQYAQMLLEIGEGDLFSERVQPLVDDMDTGSTLVRLPLIGTIFDQKAAIDFVFPNGFDSNTMHCSSILAATNEDGDVWNEAIQDLNPNPVKEYHSADIFDEVDDPYGFIAEMMTTEALNSFTRNGCPPHKLKLKVGDICIILRNLAKKMDCQITQEFEYCF